MLITLSHTEQGLRNEQSKGGQEEQWRRSLWRPGLYIVIAWHEWTHLLNKDRQLLVCATYLILYTAAPYWTKYLHRHNHLILPSILPSVVSVVFARSKARFSLNMLASAPRPLYIERERGQCRGPRQLIWIDWFAARSKDVRERRSLWCCVRAWASRSFLLLR